MNEAYYIKTLTFWRGLNISDKKNICIFFLKGKYHLNEHLKQVGFQNCCMSEITVLKASPVNVAKGDAWNVE